MVWNLRLLFDHKEKCVLYPPEQCRHHAPRQLELTRHTFRQTLCILPQSQNTLCIAMIACLVLLKEVSHRPSP